MDDVIFDEFFDDFDDINTLNTLNEEYCRCLAYDIIKSKNICVVTGAGISVSAGIPDFRSKEGIWRRYDPSIYGSMNGFLSHPENFWKMSMELHSSMIDKVPTKTHIALSKLQKFGKLSHIITQNVDGLHQACGTSNVYEVHGNTRQCKCIECDYTIQFDELLKEHKQPWIDIPRCPKCNNLVKLDVVLFGEELNREIYDKISQIVTNCDLMIVVGCSLEVNPVNLFPKKAKMNHSQVAIVNLTGTKCDNICDYVIRGESDVLIPKIVDYVEKYMMYGFGKLRIPMNYLKKTYEFVRELVCGVISIGVEQMQGMLDELKVFCKFGNVGSKGTIGKREDELIKNE